MLERLAKWVSRIGAKTINAIRRTGAASYFLIQILFNSGPGFGRPHLVIREIYFAGVLSLIIIMVSGFFVGMVLGLQGSKRCRSMGRKKT